MLLPPFCSIRQHISKLPLHPINHHHCHNTHTLISPKHSPNAPPGQCKDDRNTRVGGCLENGVEKTDWLDVSGGRWLDVGGNDDGLAPSIDDLADFFEAAEEAFAVVGIGGVGELGVAELGEEREGGCVEILGDDLRAVGLVEAFKTDQAFFWFCHSKELSLLLLLELEELVLLLEEERHELGVDGVSVDVDTSSIVGSTLAARRSKALTTVTTSVALLIVHHHVATSSKRVVEVMISGQTTKTKSTGTNPRKRGGGCIGIATLILITTVVVVIVLRRTI